MSSKMVKLQQTSIDSEKLKQQIRKTFVTASNDCDSKNSVLKMIFIDTPPGSMVAVSDDQYLLMLNFIDSKHLNDEMKHLIKKQSKSIIHDELAKPLISIKTELDAYFSGKLTEFHTPYSIDPTVTEFQHSVLDVIHKIEYGKTSTYSEVANIVGKPKSYRAVANACGRNPITIIIPCHRVLPAGGRLGGYRCGADKKDWLLNHEEKQMNK